ncbi:MAG: NFACT family protein [Spirochaetaceae bacterium]|nr:NFACT family protein [Spirochaetaceae bacterium]
MAPVIIEELFLSLNWKEIDLILHELALPGMQIQKIYQSTYDVLAVQVYGGVPRGTHCILVCLSPRACRIHETFCPVPKSEKPLRFAEFLKSRIINGRIEEAVQLGHDRIIRLTVKRGETSCRIYIKLWSNAANVIVTDTAGLILDAMKRLPKRGETAGFSYGPENAPAPGVRQVGVRQVDGERNPAKDYQVRDLPGAGSFNRRVDDWYTEHSGALSLEQLREEVRRTLGKSRIRLETALERLREKEADYTEGERFREYGDLILANSASVEAGASWLEAERFSPDGDSDRRSSDLVRIELDPRKNPAKNAEGYYEKYRKAKSGLGDVREEIAAGEREIKRITETEERLLAETNPLKLQALFKKIRKGTPVREERGKKGQKRPGLSFADGDWLILVGRNAGENDELLRRHVKGSDLWLHVRDWGGSYVFIKYRPGKTVPLEILLDAGNLALFYSKGRASGRGDLYYTQVKYLRRAKNGPKGLVIPAQEKNLGIVLDRNRLKRLEESKLYQP